MHGRPGRGLGRLRRRQVCVLETPLGHVLDDFLVQILVSLSSAILEICSVWQRYDLVTPDMCNFIRINLQMTGVAGSSLETAEF